MVGEEKGEERIGKGGREVPSFPVVPVSFLFFFLKINEIIWILFSAHNYTICLYDKRKQNGLDIPYHSEVNHQSLVQYYAF
jgi:hypothetical protein